MVSVPPHQPNAAHSRASSGPSQGASGGSGDSSANLFSSGEGLWTYIQALESRLQQQDEKLRLQEEKIAALEVTKHRHETQITYLTEDLRALHGGQTPATQQQDSTEQAVAKS